MGTICDRTQEHIGPSDLPIIAVRRRLKDAVTAVLADQEPPGLNPLTHRVRPAAVLLPPDIPFPAGAQEALTADAESYAVRV